MKLSIKVLAASLLIVLMSFTAHAGDKAATDEKPVVQDVALLTIEATVENIDREARQVTLKGKEGKSVTLSLDDEAGKLDEIDVGDLVAIDYLEAVTIQAFGPDEIEPGITAEELAAEVKRLEYWINGKDAHRVGFVDHLVQELAPEK